jgi:hypothetical protein
MRIAIVALAVGLLAAATFAAVARPRWAPLYAALAFAGVCVLLPLRDARVTLTPDHLLVQNLARIYALPLAGIRRPVVDARGGVALVVYFHPDYPVRPGLMLPPGWRAKHRRKRLRQIRVFALANDDELLREVLVRAALAREAVELRLFGLGGRSPDEEDPP